MPTMYKKPLKMLVKLTESELKEMIEDSLKEFYNEKSIRFRIINEDYNKILNEEYGIDFETEIATNDIADKIKKTFKNETNVSTDKNGIKNYNGSTQYTYKDKEITIKYRIVNFVSEKIFDQLYFLYNFNAEYKIEENSIYLTIAMYNGGFVVETFHNSLQHELSHIFEKIKNNNISPKKEKEIYNTARNQIKNPISEQSFELANAVYLTFKSEQIAMCNGVDAMFRNNKNNPFFNVGQTNEYNYLYYIKKVIENIDQYKNLIEKFYKMTERKMLMRLNKAYSDYLRRLGRVEIKWRQKK